MSEIEGAVFKGRRMKAPLFKLARPLPTCGGPIDRDVVPLVAVFNDFETVTHGSCSGHGREPAYVSFYVYGMEGLERVTKRLGLCRIDPEILASELCIDLRLIWGDCAFLGENPEHYPGWLLFSMHLDCDDGPVPVPILQRLALAYENARVLIPEPTWDLGGQEKRPHCVR